MSILIKGMEMPKGCATCPYCDRAWNKPKCKAKSMQGRFMEQRLNLDRTRQKWCPLAPVPTPHGRLIDADAFIKEKTEQICENCDNRRGMKDGKLTKKFVYAIGDAPCRACYVDDMLGYLEDAPTIITAEEGE